MVVHGRKCYGVHGLMSFLIYVQLDVFSAFQMHKNMLPLSDFVSVLDSEFRMF